MKPNVLLAALICFLGGPAELAHAEQIQVNEPNSEGRPEVPTATAPLPSEEPASAPRKPGVVLESSLGAFGALGQFRRVAPPGFLARIHGGYELFPWLMPFAEAELGFTDTSVSQSESKVRAFPIYGFGTGARFTWRPRPRVGLFAQGSLGFFKADVPANALAMMGYRRAEILAPYFGGRAGVEWYQRDRHLALALSGGLRDATGFARTTGGDVPLFWDGEVALRYTF